MQRYPVLSSSKQLWAVWCCLLLHLLPAHAAWHECNSQGVFPGLYGSEVLANLTSFRSNLLSEVWQSFNPAAAYPKGFGRFDPVSAFIDCPPNRPLVPYAGRWRFCDLSRLAAPCVVYSIGPPGDYSFEKDVIEQTQCEVHTLDCSSEGKSIHKTRHKHHKWCIGSSGPDHKTLGEVTRQLGHLRGIDAARIDVEGAEPGLLSELKHSTPLPRQISMEMHLRPLPPKETAIAAPAARTPAQLGLLFMHLASLGYGVTSRQDNQGGQPGCCAEFSFLHVERLWAHGAARAAHSRAASTQPGSNGAAVTVGSTPPAAAAAQAAGPPRVKRLVVSMASFPGRAEFANPTVYSIMHGRRVPDALYFWVAVNVSRFSLEDAEVNSQQEIPPQAKELEKQFPGVVKVMVPPKDYGPATKLLPTLLEEKDPDTVIVTVDDDSYYRPNTVFDLEQEIIKRPGYVIVRSCETTHWDPKKDPPKKGWRQWKVDEGACRGFITAFASAGYRREFLDDLVFDQDRAPTGCLHHDDIWFSAHLWLRNVPIWVLPGFGSDRWPVLYHRPKNRMSISMHPEAEKKAHECLDYFGWMDNAEVRKMLLGDRKPYKPFD